MGGLLFIYILNEKLMALLYIKAPDFPWVSFVFYWFAVVGILITQDSLQYPPSNSP
jgi:hypothetical protein